MRSRFHSAARTCAVDVASSGGSAISPKNRYISPRVDPVLCLQPLGDIDPKVVAHIRRRVTQHLMGSVDRIESGADPLPCRLGAQC